MGKRPKQTFLQRRHIDDKVQEKMLDNANYQRNANTNDCSEISPHTSQNGHHQKIYK